MKRVVISVMMLAMVLAFAGCKDKHEHSYSAAVTKEASCTEDGVKTLTCACGDTYTEAIPAAGEHDWGIWSTEAHALVGKPGVEKRICKRCAAFEERERTANAIPNSFYDSGLQYIIDAEGLLTGYSLLNYARHEFHQFMYKPTPTATLFAELEKYFDLTDAMKADMIDEGIEDARVAAQYGTEGNYGYNSTEDTFTLSYNAESMNFKLLGYIHNGDSNYTIYCVCSEFGFEETPESIWRVVLEYNKLNGAPNKYISVNEVSATPDNMIACPEGEMSELIG